MLVAWTWCQTNQSRTAAANVPTCPKVPEQTVRSNRTPIVCNEHTLLPTRLPIAIYVHVLYHSCIYNPFPEDEPSGSKHVADIEIKN